MQANTEAVEKFTETKGNFTLEHPHIEARYKKAQETFAKYQTYLSEERKRTGKKQQLKTKATVCEEIEEQELHD